MKKKITIATMVCLVLSIILVFIGSIYLKEERDLFDEFDIEPEMIIEGEYVYSISLSDDDRYLLYLVDDGEYDYSINDYTHMICIYDLEEKVSREITEVKGWDSRPIFNSDHSKIYFTEDDNIHVIDVDGSNRENITDEGGFHSILHPDGDRIVFEKYGNPYTYETRFGNETEYTRNIWIMNLDGTGENKLTNFSIPFNVHLADISPDGSKVLFSISQVGHWIEAIIPYPEPEEDLHGVWEVDIESGALINLLNEEVWAVGYSPDGEFISYAYGMYAHHSYLWIMTSDGSRERQISHVNAFEYYYKEIEFHPANEEVYYTVQVHEYDPFCELWKTSGDDGEHVRLTRNYDPSNILELTFNSDGSVLYYKTYDFTYDDHKEKIWSVKIP